MKQAKQAFLLFLMLFLVLNSGGFVLAQEATEVPVEAGEVIVVGGSDEAPADNVQVNLITIIIGLLTAFAAGGVVGIGGLSIFVQRLQKDTATVTALEKLAASYPPETKEILLGISRGLENIGRFGAEVFDDLPVVNKPQTPSEPLSHVGDV